MECSVLFGDFCGRCDAAECFSCSLPSVLFRGQCRAACSLECLHGGFCELTDDGQQCACSADFHGDRCQTPRLALLSTTATQNGRAASATAFEFDRPVVVTSVIDKPEGLQVDGVALTAASMAVDQGSLQHLYQANESTLLGDEFSVHFFFDGQLNVVSITFNPRQHLFNHSTRVAFDLSASFVLWGSSNASMSVVDFSFALDQAPVSMTFAVVEPGVEVSDNGLSGGAIAGIVIGSSCGLLAAIALILFWRRRRSKLTSSAKNGGVGMVEIVSGGH